MSDLVWSGPHIWPTMRALTYFQHLIMVQKPLEIEPLEEQMWRAP